MWKFLSSKEIFSHPRLTLIEDKVMLPDKSETAYLRFKDDDSKGCIVIAENKDKRILLLKEYSYPQDAMLYQFPSGRIAANEDMANAAVRELMEEAKCFANGVALLGSFYKNHRRSNFKIYVYLATDLEEVGLTERKEEEIETEWLTEKEIDRMAIDGKIINGYALAAWSLYKAQV